jgi:hypothetical protein
MEGFETIRTPASYFGGLKDDGYTSKQRGGSRTGLIGLRVLHVIIARGADLPPCVVARWDGGELSSDTYTAKTFTNETELAAWLAEWHIQLGRCRRL